MLAVFALLVTCFTAVTRAHTPEAAAGTVTRCATTHREYSVVVCMTAPGPDQPISVNPIISATAEVSDPKITVLSLKFELDDRSILSDFDPDYAFELPLNFWADGVHTLAAKARLSDKSESDPVATTLTFFTKTAVPVPPDNQFAPATGRPAGDGPFVLAAVGDGAGGSPQSEAVVNLISSWNPNMFLYLGDVYNSGTATEFFNWYGPNRFFGRFRDITNPTPGNHEYSGSSGPQGYLQYWGNPPRYYSVDTAGWHIVSLDSNPKFNETDPASQQMQWLVKDLEASTAPCTLVFFHHPRFSVGTHGDDDSLVALWRILAQHNVTLVLQGHDHDYQRWQPLDKDGFVDPAGPVSLVVGTGGQSEYVAKHKDERLAVPLLVDTGAVRIELNPAGASLQFITTDGVVRDSAVTACDKGGTIADATAPTAPGTPAAVSGTDGSVTLTWDQSRDETGVAAYDIYRDDQLIGSAPPESAYIDADGSGAASATYTVVARDGAGNSSPSSAAVTVDRAQAPGVMFDDSFASGSLMRWSSNSGLEINATGADAAGWVARARGGIRSAYALHTLNPAFVEGDRLDLQFTIRFCIMSQADNPVVLLRLRTDDKKSLFGVNVSAGGTLDLFNDRAGAGLRSGQPVATGVWHTLTVHLTGTPDAAQAEVALDGRDLPELTEQLDLQGVSITQLQLGDSTGYRLYDVAYGQVIVDSQLAPGADSGSSASAFGDAATPLEPMLILGTPISLPP
jgi:hypothetical protein